MSIALNLDHSSAIRPAATSRPSLIGLTKPQLVEALTTAGIAADKEARMRASQLWNWLYVNGTTDFEQMSNIAKPVRQKLADVFNLGRPEIVSEQVSTDGTRKWLFRFRDPANPNYPPVEVETVYIPEEDRGTLCVSSQVGCTLTCSFCHTGTQKLVRNLTAGEILGQILMAREQLGDFPGGTRPADGGLVPSAGTRAITNVVMMGMGEPLYNYENVKQALLIGVADDGMNLSRRRITLSTSGVVPFIEPTGREIDVMLAISLHATNNDLRDVLVPINKKYPLEELLEACRTYPGVSNSRRITFEYVMLDGINDSDAEAHELVRLLKGIPAKINLIPFNPWPGANYGTSPSSRIERFADIVNRAGYASPVRTPRGRDIFAACGQLKSDSERLSKKDREALAG
ncbi:23S rRNA (adenine(2503)-C(2))-methyltransferase RlmN [Devosia neptuniae]|uniref:23S rRNA (adenine(2503)-C(2))-methyltransferase RlmN n=1 Tax=Devosia TaxID=46913 RepID=UPI0022AEF771|nr:23S rRNA (adenine(2503)-C(2))-methyltransferase RlmN [Devosia neptuniae]MCZ4347362.1 23S rRNA (adenine(2503)-C(2))-methyltransferase RlmN [Devosia neptuniae]